MSAAILRNTLERQVWGRLRAVRLMEPDQVAIIHNIRSSALAAAIPGAALGNLSSVHSLRRGPQLQEIQLTAYQVPSV